jgi:hypothetical protein
MRAEGPNLPRAGKLTAGTQIFHEVTHQCDRVAEHWLGGIDAEGAGKRS